MIPVDKIERLLLRVRELYNSDPHHVAFFNDVNELFRQELPALSQSQRQDELRASGLWDQFLDLHQQLVRRYQAIPSDAMRIHTARWPAALHEALRLRAYEEHTSMNQLITHICAEYVGLDTPSPEEKGEPCPNSYSSTSTTQRASSDAKPSGG